MIEVEMPIWVRKYEVDTESLKRLMREHRPTSYQWLAEQLDVPLTMVEHWFRKDKCFSIPDPQYWFDIKRLLDIDTDEFDAPITEIEERAGSYDMGNRIYDDEVAPTLSTQVTNMWFLVDG